MDKIHALQGTDQFVFGQRAFMAEDRAAGRVLDDNGGRH